MRDDFAVFILTHGRPDKVVTLKALLAGNYTGKYYLVIDNEDDKADEYYRLFGDDKVIMFDKIEQAKKTDTADLSDDRRAIVFARNACFDIAEKLGIKYFLELDDDYTSFLFRFQEGTKLGSANCKDLDRLFEEMLIFLETSGALTVALCQGGDLIGGLKSGTFKKGLLRKAMNTFFCKTENRIEWAGRMNEDVSAYTLMSNQGKLFFTITAAQICQLPTQSLAGGMSEVYLDSGTYQKSFYSVLFSPQCVKISLMGGAHKRIHHNVEWEHCAPKILNEKWKK